MFADYTSSIRDFGYPVQPIRRYYHNGLTPFTVNVDPRQPSTYAISSHPDQHAQFNPLQNYPQQNFLPSAPPEPIRPMAIRRHTPGDLDPPVEKAPVPVIFFTPVYPTIASPVPVGQFVQSIVPQSPTEAAVQHTTAQPIPTEFVQEQPAAAAVPLDPSDRPIRPMRDTSVYNNPAPLARPGEVRRPLPPIQPLPTTTGRESGAFETVQKPPLVSPHVPMVRIVSPSKTVSNVAHRPFERMHSAPRPFQPSVGERVNRQTSAILAGPSVGSQTTGPGTLSPLNPRMRNVSARRPVRLDAHTVFDDDVLPYHDRRRPIVVHDYDSYDHRYHEPRRILVHQGDPRNRARRTHDERFALDRVPVANTLVHPY